MAKDREAAEARSTQASAWSAWPLDYVVKRLWGFGKVRYRGLRKNTARVFTAFALANLYLVRRRLLPAGAECVL
jgi:IS5 family transposase